MPGIALDAGDPRVKDTVPDTQWPQFWEEAQQH